MNSHRRGAGPTSFLVQVNRVAGAGITSGFDAYKCMALGADAISVGRHLMPFLQNGADAVANRIKAMTSELAGVMTATGVHNLSEFDPSVIHRVL